MKHCHNKLVFPISISSVSKSSSISFLVTKKSFELHVCESVIKSIHKVSLAQAQASSTVVLPINPFCDYTIGGPFKAVVLSLLCYILYPVDSM